jgi:acyl-CoA thioesterase
MLAADKASTALGIAPVELRDGYALLRMTVAENMINGHGIAHGGYVFLLADTAFACACNRTRFGRSGIYDITVRRGTEIVAEFRGRSRTLRA